MKVSFWRIFFASLLATVVVSIIGWVITIMVIGGLLSETPDPSDKQVLRLTLSGVIQEKTDVSIDPSSFSVSRTTGLSELLAGFEEARQDDGVKGILLELKNVQCGYTTARELREAIHRFRKSGKFVIAYLSGELITQKQYYISAAASEVYGFHTSIIEFLGLGSEYMYYKNGLDKLGVEVQIVRGSNNDFKSAVEPFFRTEMSDSSKLQTNKYMQGIWGTIKKDLSVDRHIAENELNRYAEQQLIQRLDDAFKYKLIDGVCYRDELVQKLNKKSGSKIDLSNLQSFEKYAHKKFKLQQAVQSDEKVAVVLAEGGIAVSGDEMTSKDICAHFQEVRNDKSIQVVVFRVNSPGGSALASEEIWREVSLTAKKKKVIVSMGDVAASGGYYIATPATRIFAEPTTITGSIGVFGMIPYTGKLFENYFGITFDRVQTNAHAVLSLNRKLTPEEFLKIQAEVDNTYTKFKQRVSEGRGLTTEQVERIARGRVWVGLDAVKIGLVDEIGGLNDAIAYAKKLIHAPTAKVKYWPEVKDDQFDALLEDLGEQLKSNDRVKSTALPMELQQALNELNVLQSKSGIQMRLNQVPNFR